MEPSPSLRSILPKIWNGDYNDAINQIRGFTSDSDIKKIAKSIFSTYQPPHSKHTFTQAWTIIRYTLSSAISFLFTNTFKNSFDKFLPPNTHLLSDIKNKETSDTSSVDEEDIYYDAEEQPMNLEGSPSLSTQPLSNTEKGENSDASSVDEGDIYYDAEQQPVDLEGSPSLNIGTTPLAQALQVPDELLQDIYNNNSSEEAAILKKENDIFLGNLAYLKRVPVIGSFIEKIKGFHSIGRPFLSGNPLGQRTKDALSDILLEITSKGMSTDVLEKAKTLPKTFSVFDLLEFILTDQETKKNLLSIFHSWNPSKALISNLIKFALGFLIQREKMYTDFLVNHLPEDKKTLPINVGLTPQSFAAFAQKFHFDKDLTEKASQALFEEKNYDSFVTCLVDMVKKS